MNLWSLAARATNRKGLCVSRSEPRQRRRTWVALLSLSAPFMALFGHTEPVGLAFDHPARVSYYSQSVLLVGPDITLGVGVLVWGKTTTPAWLRYLSVTLGVAGIVVGVFFLLTLAGLCGPSVLWGYCQS